MIYELSKEYYVRSLIEADMLGPYLSWFDDQDVCMYNSHGKFSKSEHDYKNYILNMGKGQESLVWAICSIADGHIGNVSLTEISFINRKAQFGIILGDKNHWGKGVGTLASKKIIDHGFRKLNLNRIYCCVVRENVGMIGLANSIGMSQEGILRSNSWIDGKWTDDIQFGILSSDYFVKDHKINC